MDLQNKIAVITGASGGIGTALVKKMQDLGAEIIPVSIDLTKSAEIDRFVSDFKARHDRIDLLVHIAGVGVFKPLPAISKEEWDHSFSLNVTAPFLLTKELLPLLQKSPDSLILAIGSRDGVVGIAQRSLYCATKFALRGLFLSLTEEFKTRSPKFCLITLGSVLTNFAGVSVEEKLQRQKAGKAYFTSVEVADKLLEIIKTVSPEPEYTLYPAPKPV